MDLHPNLKKQYKTSPWVMLVLIVLAVCFVALFPFIVIWSLNTLFNLGLLYTWQTWLASLILTSVVSGSIVRKK